MFGLFALSVVGGSVFVNFVDGLIGGPVSMTYMDKVLLLESSLLGFLLYLGFRALSLLRGGFTYVVSSPFFRMWFLVFLRSQPFVYVYFLFSSAVKTVFDSGWFERFGGLGSYDLVMTTSLATSRYHQSFVGLTVFGAAACLLFVLMLL